MRKVLKDRQEVAHYWANQVQPEGQAGNMIYRADKIFSYGLHFCIARILPSGTVVFTTRTYSSSTQRHISIARSAARHRAIVYCNDPATSARENMESALRSVRSALSDANKPRIRESTRTVHKAQALHRAEQANAYLAALPADERENVAPIDTSALEDMHADLATFEAAQAKLKAEQFASRKAELLDSLAQWRTHALGSRTALSELPVALRLSYQDKSKFSEGTWNIETSHGAEIPVSFARRLWPLILQTKLAGAEWNSPPAKSYPLGNYTLKTIRPDGSIVVGCHDIPFAEMEAMARELGLTSQEVSAS